MIMRLCLQMRLCHRQCQKVVLLRPRVAWAPKGSQLVNIRNMGQAIRLPLILLRAWKAWPQALMAWLPQTRRVLYPVQKILRQPPKTMAVWARLPVRLTVLRLAVLNQLCLTLLMQLSVPLWTELWNKAVHQPRLILPVILPVILALQRLKMMALSRTHRPAWAK